jgi:peptidyl-dipeptidase A
MRPAETLVADLEARLRPLELELSEAWWEANTKSSPAGDERRTRAELAHRALFADADLFAEVRAVRDAGVDDPLLARQLDVLHDAFVPNQVDPELMREIVELETQVASTFNTYRATLDGRLVDDNDIAEILRASDDVDERRAAWEAAKSIGPEVAERVRELARLRNAAARGLGFRDHFALALATGELDEDRLFATLDEVDRATAEPFAAWKADLDAALATRFDVSADALRPWHLEDPFFQTPPSAGAVAIDHLFAGSDLEALTLRTYDGLGLDVRAVLTHSDLYARDGKSQHAFCIDMDRDGDVRVLCNVEPSERWMDTMLHEFGHAIYDRECDPSLPWLLRGAAHALTTEGIAMLMGRLPRQAEWLSAVAEIDADVLDDDLRTGLVQSRRAALLVFARWVLVMTNFERALYDDPDRDLDTLWWDLVERHQLVRRPDDRQAPDWASKIHLAVAPVYYQNYLYGELFASQLQAALDARAGGLVDAPDAGALLVHDVFSPGASQRWDALVVAATGAPLSARAFAQELRG